MHQSDCHRKCPPITELVVWDSDHTLDSAIFMPKNKERGKPGGDIEKGVF
jgi:hypothetical protein